MASDQEKEEKQQEQQQQDKDTDKENGQRFITELPDKDLEKQREAEEEKARERARKRKLIPPFVMLFAGAIVSIMLRVLQYELKDMLIILLCVLIGFYFAGSVLKWMLDQFEEQIEKARMDEGEVIEKDLEAEDDTEDVDKQTNEGVMDDETEEAASGE